MIDARDGLKAPVLLIEFNELSPTLLARLMEGGSLPNFRRFFEASHTYVTDAGETDDRLQPWIAWPSVHTGVPYREHGLYLLGEAEKLRCPLVGQCLSEAGVRVGVFGSMNVPYHGLNGFVFPDPWSKDARTEPAALQPLYDAIATQIQEAATHGKLSLTEAARLAASLIANGLTPQTVAMVVAQLVGERRTKGGTRWRRASLLDNLEYDVFARLVRKHRVEFASFFSNSTAHYQHYYWRNMEPEIFPSPPGKSDHASLADAVPYGYRAMDRLLARFMHDFPEHLMVLCTALSQHPHTGATGQGLRPRSFGDFFRFARIDVPGDAVKPVMAEQFHIVCATEAQAIAVTERLAELTLDGAPLMDFRREGSNVFAGARWIDVPTGSDASLEPLVIVNGTGARAALVSLFQPLPGQRSGTHHPDGVLWIRTGRHAVAERKVPIESIAPAILRYFGVVPPNGMRARSLEFAS